MNTTPKFVEAYRANFTVDDVECALKSESPSNLQQQITKLLNPAKVRFDAGQSSRAQSIYADNEWIGNISQTQVPAHLTVTARHEQQKKAAERQAA